MGSGLGVSQSVVGFEKVVVGGTGRRQLQHRIRSNDEEEEGAMQRDAKASELALTHFLVARARWPLEAAQILRAYLKGRERRQTKRCGRIMS